MGRKIAIVGAGWAGMAAAVAAAQAGHDATIFEASRKVGGRASTVFHPQPDGPPLVLDNGQHILIGAYTECLRLMRLVGVDVDAALLRLPLALTFPDGSGLRLPDLPPPWDTLVGIARAHGWGWRDKLALLHTAAAWQRRGFGCAPTASVAQLCARLPRRLLDEFIDPLCVSALNTPAHEASGQVFLRVLRDSLFSGRGGSNLLLPRTDLGQLFPEAAARWLQTHGGALHTGRRVQTLARMPDGRWQLAWATGNNTPPAEFDQVVLACPPWEASRLVAGLTGLSSNERRTVARWCQQANALKFTAITTVYACAPGVRLPQPMLALRSGPEAPAQFVFDRGQLGGPPGLLALVVSASPIDQRDALAQQVLQQARQALGAWGSGDLQLLQTLVEKRATFACTPGLERPDREVLPGLTAGGDYVQGPYPATLEGAVRQA